MHKSPWNNYLIFPCYRLWVVKIHNYWKCKFLLTKDPKQIPLIKNWFNFGKPIWTQSKNPVLEGWFGCIKTEIPKKRLKKTSWSTVLQYTEARRSQQEPIGARLFWVEPLQFYAFFIHNFMKRKLNFAHFPMLAYWFQFSLFFCLIMSINDEY